MQTEKVVESAGAAVLPHQEQPTRVRYMVMVFLGLLAFLTYFDRVCIAWAQDEISKDLGLSDRQMGLILGVFWFAYALFEIPGGWLADWFGARKALVRIVIAWSVFTALSGCATGFWSLFFYRFMFGVGEAGAFPAMARVQSKWLPIDSRAWFGGVLWMLSRWGGAFSPIIFGWMMTRFQTEGFKTFVAAIPGLKWAANVEAWRLGFVASGLLGVVWVAFFFPWFRDDPVEKKGVNDAELELIKKGRTRRDEGHGHDTRIFGKLFTSAPLWIVAGIGLTMSYVFSFWVSWLPKYLKTVQGIDLKSDKWWSVAPMLFMGISCMVTGRLADALVRRTGRKRFWRAFFPITGMIIAAIAFISIQHAPNRTVALTLLVIAAFAIDMNQSCHWANIVDIGGAYAAMAFGFMNMIGNIGNAAGPSINERIFNTFSWDALFWVNAAVLMVAAFLWLFNDPNKRFYEVADPETPQGFEVKMKI